MATTPTPAAGRTTRARATAAPAANNPSWIRNAWAKTPRWVVRLVAILLVLFIGYIIFWPVGVKSVDTKSDADGIAENIRLKKEIEELKKSRQTVTLPVVPSPSAPVAPQPSATPEDGRRLQAVQRGKWLDIAPAPEGVESKFDPMGEIKYDGIPKSLGVRDASGKYVLQPERLADVRYEVAAAVQPLAARKASHQEIKAATIAAAKKAFVAMGAPNVKVYFP